MSGVSDSERNEQSPNESEDGLRSVSDEDTTVFDLLLLALIFFFLSFVSLFV